MPSALAATPVFAMLLFTGISQAQAFTDELARAQAQIDAGEWTTALATLIGLQDRAAVDSERELLATRLGAVGQTLEETSAFAHALHSHEAALILWQRVHARSDHAQVAKSLERIGFCLSSLGRDDEALLRFEDALAMRQRLYGGLDHADVALSLNYVAGSIDSLGRTAEALPIYETALAMARRLHADSDHPDVALSLNNVAYCLKSLGRAREALPLYQQAFAMQQQYHGDRDDVDLAGSQINVGSCLQTLGRAEEALPHYEQALAMQRRLIGDRDHPHLAIGLAHLAACLQALGRGSEALPHYEEALAMRRRLFGDHDHPDVATSLNDVAGCLHQLGRATDALPRYQQALAMSQRVYGNRDHPHVARGLHNVAACVASLGRPDEALLLHESALAMYERLCGGRDHPYVASAHSAVAGCLESQGRASDALLQHEAVLAMRRRLHGDNDHPEIAAGLNNVACCLGSLGRAGEALPQHEAAVAMMQRLHGHQDHPDVAIGLHSLAYCLLSLGRFDDAVQMCESALAMAARLYGEADHPDVATGINNLASALKSLGRVQEALPHFEAALAMQRRLYGGRDHVHVAACLMNVANCLSSLGSVGEALSRHEAALAMQRRLYGGRDNAYVASSLSHVALCLQALGRADEALPQYEQALAMRKRLFGEADHPHVAHGLSNLAFCLQALGRTADALPPCQQAVAMIERLRDASRTSAELRQSLFDDLKSGGAFERLQALTVALALPAESALAAERSRGRGLLDLLEQHRFDPLDEAERRADLRGDDAGRERLQALRHDLTSAEQQSDRLLHDLAALDDVQISDADRDARREELLARSTAVGLRLRQLHDERARILGDVLPVGKVSTAAEIQAALQPGELLLEFTVTSRVSILHVVSPGDAIEAILLPAAHATQARVLPGLLQRSSHVQLAVRGRQPDGAAATDAAADLTSSRELFASLFPGGVWERVRASRRVFVVAHRELHRLPFESLVTDVIDDKPVYWLDAGPAISYVPSGSALHWLRQRAREASDDPTSLDLLTVADPSDLAAEPEVPAEGAFVLVVNDSSEGARVGLLARDVLLRYDGRLLADDASLRDLRTQTDAAIEDGKRPDTPIPIEVWRRGERLQLEVKKGLLGIQVGKGKARAAYEASLGGDAQRERVTRAGDLERLRQLPPLRGARAEALAIDEVFAAKEATTKRLVGAHATESAVFDLAAKAKYLHFACHGIAEEYAGQSLSMLVLSQPQHVLPGDDGLLKLGDLLHNWRGRLSSCRLVVLSACRTNVGPTLRDEAPQALPIGFLFAGVPSVISSLWAVDDASTRELMTDFYGRLLAGETDRLKAFTDAKKALRQKYPDPFHWAPFLFLGSPE